MFCILQRGSALFCLCAVLAAADPPGIWLDVPFVKQERNGCGAASVAMVMKYWQRQHIEVPEADAETIQRSLYSQRAHGIYASDLESYFAGHGFRAFAFAGQWDDLKKQLENGRPLIVALKPGSSAELHYVVVVGLDWEQSLVLVNDPAERKLLKQDRAHFEDEWKEAGNWTLLATPQKDASSAR